MNRRLPALPLWLEVTLSLLVAFAAASAISIAILRSSDEQRIARFGTGFFAERVASVVQAVLGFEPDMRSALVRRLSSESMAVTLNTEFLVPKGSRRALPVEAAVRERLNPSALPAGVAQRVKSGLRAVYIGEGPGEEKTSFDEVPEKQLATAQHAVPSGILVGIPDDRAGWVVVRIDFLRPRASHTALLWSIGVNVLAFVLVALWISWRFASPATRLGLAATELRRGRLRVSVNESGPEPMREAARAFNQMATQISATLKSQQVLMAAVAHDLRTPISVLRFRAEMVQDPDLRAKLISTVDEMQAMTSAVLDAVRPEDAGEVPRLLDIGALVSSLCEDLRDAGKDIVYEGASMTASCICRETQVRRAIRNLMDNAIRYGLRARARVDVDGSSVVVTIDDDGPGIAVDELERVFEPFTRLEDSRSRDTGGYGLGLPIARLAARSHGGDVTLQNLPGRGVRARLTLAKG